MTIIIFLILLSVLVLVHETGHFIAAKKLGVVPEEFGLGLPPRIKKLFVWQKTEFSLNWLPIGGFVRLRGEDRETKGKSQGAFFAQKPWKRAVILLAGVTMNLVLAIIVFTAVYTSLGIPEISDEVRIEAVAPGSPAEQAGLRVNDVLQQLTIGDQKFSVSDSDQFVNLIDQNRGQEVILVVNRDGAERAAITVIPRTETDTPAGEGALGIAISKLKLVHYPWWQMPLRASVVGVEEAVSWGVSILAGLADMVARWVILGQLPSDIAGPVGIARLTGEVASHGWIPLFQFTGILSINLAIINFLPVPALDGGRLLFVIIEKIRGRPVNPRKERWLHLLGYVVLVSLILLVTIQDVIRLLSS